MIKNKYKIYTAILQLFQSYKLWKSSLFIITFLILNSQFSILNSQTPPVAKCKECHKPVIEKPVVHSPMDDCTNCHKSNSNTHPQANVKGFDLTDKVPQLCYTCHEPLTTKKTIHPPVESGDCLSCHSPHNSDNKNLLIISPTAMLCISCHDDIKLDTALLKHPDNKTSAHVAKSAQGSVHPPFAGGKCIVCHDPHQSDFPKLVKLEKASLCLQCHEKQKAQIIKDTTISDQRSTINDQLKYIHPPFKNNCLSCHSPHTSKESHLLSEKVPALCFGCHTEKQDVIAKSHYIHGPVKDSKACLNCHSPHGSDNKSFLKLESKELCLSCHDKIITTDTKTIINISQVLKSKFVHGAIESDGCIGCHNPHASNTDFLLVDAFPDRTYALANKDTFALCFKCHDPAMLQKDAPASATGFRNGDINLHYVHVNGNKGRTCIICHNVHASNNEHLINDKYKFGSWDMKLNFVPSQSGGSCLPGCHAPKKYIR